jgi:hypothetical protein
MPEYTLLATCDRCKKQVVSNPGNGSIQVIDATGLQYHGYVHQAHCSSRGAYLCPECHGIAEEMKERHDREREEFCLALTP